MESGVRLKDLRALMIGLALAVCGAWAVFAADEPSTREAGNPRDVAAIQEADKGWWTESMKMRDQRLAWWREARFGCFIHWGVYSGPGGVWNGKSSGTYAEHLMRTQKIPLQEYKDKVVSVFDPEKFDADQWVALIKGAGMKYVIITAKHHDGFAMWPSDVNKYNIRDMTKFKRDPMRELCDACRRNGIRFGFYYSHAFDWEDPNAPGNDWDYQNPGGDRKLFGGADWYDVHPEIVPRVQKYVDGKAIPELKELIERYHPDIFWFDTPQKLPLSLQLRVVQAVREADPDVVINGRAARGLDRNFGDYQDTADRPAEIRPTPGDWECIPTCNESYGYHKLDNNYKSPSHFIRLLAKAAAKGGNMLLNIGPMGDGLIDPKSADILRGIGQWMAVNSQSIYGTERTPLDRQAWGDSTLKGSILYLHVFNWPTDGRLVVGGLQSDVSSAWLLSDPAKTPLTATHLNDKDILVIVPQKAPDAADSVVVLQTNGAIKAFPGRLLANDLPNQLLTFDGEAHGPLQFGDGKTARYYVTWFGGPDDYVAWNIRLNDPADFDVAVKYTTASEDDAGDFKATVAGQTLTCHLAPTSSPTDIQELKLGQVTLLAGEAEIRIQPAGENDRRSVNVFEVDLIPHAK